jgi:signal transduction histidine kinase
MSRPAPVRWLKEHPGPADVIFAGMVFAVTLTIWIGAIHDLSPAELKKFHPITTLGVVLLILQIAPLLWKRRAPLAAMLVISAATVVFYAGNFLPVTGAVPNLIITYSAAAHLERRQSFRALGIVYLTLILVVAFNAKYQRWSPADLISEGVLMATAWILGDNLRTRRAYTASVEERAARLEQEQLDSASRAVNEERARIARELHDVVAHSVSVMVVQAGAARRVMGRDPDRAADALSSIESSGRQALDELRRLLAMLRHYGDERPALAPQPTIEDLETLIAQIEEAGLPVTLIVEGQPRHLPSGVDLSVFRIVQEALTNTLKHAGPARATVRVRYEPDHLLLTITDDGRGLAEQLRSDNGERVSRGHGLVGMRERVALFDGDLRAGPKPGGGYEVTARLSLTPCPA